MLTPPPRTTATVGTFPSSVMEDERSCSSGITLPSDLSMSAGVRSMILEAVRTPLHWDEVSSPPGG